MSDEQDDSQKTEEPTQKRLDDAAEKGDVPRAQEVKHVAMLGGGLAVVMLMGGMIVNGLGPMFVNLLGAAHAIPVEPEGAQALATDLAGVTAQALMLPLALLFAAAIVAGLLQGRLLFSWERVTPKLSKISPIAGFNRLFGTQAWIEFLKTLAKVAIVGVLCFVILAPQIARLEESISYDAADLMSLIQGLIIKLMVAVLIFMAALAVLDHVQQRFAFLKRMRMSRQELKDEFKQSEGDPMVKGRLKQIRLERARKRMMAAVPEADVIITNPTHFAVALKYDHGAMAAPTVVAKGVDHVAAKIREVANANQVPLVENPPLARALYATVEIDDMIPPEHYKAVAEVISYVMKLRGRAPKRPQGPQTRGA
jgi:flagellar biosynthesis protein FlhB